MRQIAFVRHGESTWNQENKFTGWTDVDLSEQGRQEAQKAGRLLREQGFHFQRAYTSVLKRAVRTLAVIQDELDELWVPVIKAWQLNERHYGALQGLNKAELAKKYGDEQVLIWRRSYAVRPPALESSDPRHPRFDPRYQSLPPAALPATEALADTVARVVPYWESEIKPRVINGERLVVVAHGNSLRALIKHLDAMSEEAIMKLNIPTGIPLIYELSDQAQPVGHRYLGDPEAVARAQQAVAAQGQSKSL